MRICRAVAVCLLSVSCSTSARQPGIQTPADVVGTVASTTITLGQVDELAMQQPVGNFGSVKLSQAIYEARRQALDELVANLLLDGEAKTRGIDRAALIEQEVTKAVAQPTDPDAALWYQHNRERLRGATFEQSRSAIKTFLVNDRTQAARQAYLDQLKTKTTVTLLLEPPRQTIKAAGPSQGPPSAPIEMVEFSDFQCPYCLAAHATVKQVLAAYGDRIRFVYRNYPLANHADARPAAEAAQCANEQGKFWQYHDRLFTDQATLGDAGLKKSAADLGLDTAKFDACLDARKYKAVVDADIRDGDEAGVTGTPAFFINGRALVGAHPLDAFKRLIDEELALKKKS